MKKILSLLLICFIAAYPVASQTLPKEAAMLNYRLIGFSFPDFKSEGKYRLEIALGDFKVADSFEKNIIKTLVCSSGKIISEVPFWGKQYTWRIVNTARDIKSDLYHFSTILNPDMDTENVHLRIMHPAEKYKDAFVLLDNNKAMYDMNGRPVWFLPGKQFATQAPRDLRLSPMGTITLLCGTDAYEMNYNGEVLWKGPDKGTVSGDKMEYYNHELMRLKNGHYMVLGNEPVALGTNLNNRNQLEKNSEPMKPPHGTVMPKTFFGTIIEYDHDGNVVWSWKSSAYFLQEDWSNYIMPVTNDFVDTHVNAFYFDEDAGLIYIGFKNISRIVKVKYPEGTVLATYGEAYKAGVPEKINSLFCQQHSIRRSQKSYLCLFNNNVCDTNSTPKIDLFEEPIDKNGQLKKIWEYTCTVEDGYSKVCTNGGNAIELPGEEIFVCMGLPYSKIFIVDRNKKILWSALPERWDMIQKKWKVIDQYRANILYDRATLEKFIWNVEK